MAETAKLLASLELQDKFSKTADKFNSTVSGMERQTSTLGRLGGQVNQGLKNTALNLTRIGVVGGGLLAVAVKNGLESLSELEQVQTATNTVIASTKGVAGVSAEAVRKLAEQYENLNATMDDKVIQSGENLLLTFTNIDKKAFQPALEAALNMNEAMGGGPEGLQSTIIQLGKALQDPVKGFTSLKRVGVNLSADQQKQIKDLVKQNDLYGAQKIILDELSTEFGGRFAAAGDTAQGKFAKLKDAIEDAQMSLATAFLPVLSKVADKLSTFLADPKVQRQIEEFGKGLAGGLDQVVEFAGKLPWSAIGDAFKLAGTGAKAVLTAFSSLPPWIQTAVLTGWGLNKLTGGALGGIIGTLGKGLFGGMRGATPANPVFTKEVGLPGVGGGAPGVGAGAGGFLAPGLGAAIGTIAGAFFLAGVVPLIFKGPAAKPGSFQSTATTRFTTPGPGGRPTVNVVPAGTAAQWIGLMPSFPIHAYEAGTAEIVKTTQGSGTATRSAIDKLRSETRALRDPITALRSGLSTTAARTNAHLAAIERVDNATAANTGVISRKNFSPTLNANVNVTTNISINDWQRKVISSLRTSVGGGGFI